MDEGENYKYELTIILFPNKDPFHHPCLFNSDGLQN